MFSSSGGWPNHALEMGKMKSSRSGRCHWRCGSVFVVETQKTGELLSSLCLDLVWTEAPRETKLSSHEANMRWKLFYCDLSRNQGKQQKWADSDSSPQCFGPLTPTTNQQQLSQTQTLTWQRVPGLQLRMCGFQPLHSLMSAAAPHTESGEPVLLLPGNDDSLRIAVQRGAGPEAAAWAGQEAAVELEDMTRDARRVRRGWRSLRRYV